MEQIALSQISHNVKLLTPKFEIFKTEIKKVIVGQEHVIMMASIAILTRGHILLEGVPGVAKTTLIKTIAQALGLDFSRIQFTPDLLPSDIVGTLIYNPKTMDFDTKKGPIFANVILADEINRSPAKVQSALLEAMQEKQVTIGSASYLLQDPFLVFATQNPIENEGTFQLPEAQLDRFMFKLLMQYPTLEQEREILKRSYTTAVVNPVITALDLAQASQVVSQVYVDDRLVQYILEIVFSTRDPKRSGLDGLVAMIAMGASPRASIAILQASKAYAFLQGRHFVVPDDIKYVAPAILRHRIILTYQASAHDMNADGIIKSIIDSILVP